MSEIVEINTNTKNYYDELGLTEDATDQDLEKAFEMAQQKFSRQLTAYNALKNARKVAKNEIKEEYECIEVTKPVKIQIINLIRSKKTAFRKAFLKTRARSRKCTQEEFLRRSRRN